MGAWGFGPRDNDTASDFLYDFADRGNRRQLVLDRNKIINSASGLLMRKRINKYSYYDELRALAYLFAKAKIRQPYRITLREALDDILRDSEWIESWKSKSAIRSSIKRQIKGLS